MRPAEQHFAKLAPLAQCADHGLIRGRCAEFRIDGRGRGRTGRGLDHFAIAAPHGEVHGRGVAPSVRVRAAGQRERPIQPFARRRPESWRAVGRAELIGRLRRQGRSGRLPGGPPGREAAGRRKTIGRPVARSTRRRPLAARFQLKRRKLPQCHVQITGRRFQARVDFLKPGLLRLPIDPPTHARHDGHENQPMP